MTGYQTGATPAGPVRTYTVECSCSSCEKPMIHTGVMRDGNDIELQCPACQRTVRVTIDSHAWRDIEIGGVAS